MSPRNYDMSKRAAAAAATRRRIVDATRELHTEQGIAATSWDQIAARAGVGVGTVYRHFPTLDDLVPACGEISMEIVALPSAGAARALFDGLDETLEATLGALADAALVDASPEDRAVTRAMIDLDTWEALRRAGVGDPAATVTELL